MILEHPQQVIRFTIIQGKIYYSIVTHLDKTVSSAGYDDASSDMLLLKKETNNL